MSWPFNFIWGGDFHRGDATPSDGAWTAYGMNEYRRYSTFSTRLLAMLTQANTLNSGGTAISFVIQGGDFTDSNATSAVQNLIDAVAVVDGSDWAGDYLDVIGNHERSDFIADWAGTYFANLWDDRTAAEHKWTDNDDDNDGDAGKAYSVDIDGFHIIVLYATFSTHTMTAGQKTWLTNDLADANHQIPTIVFQHAWISDVYPYPATGDYVNISNASEVRTILEVDGNVQANFSTHFHEAHAPVLLNDIWYFHGWGSVDAPNANDNAYSLVKIIPNAVKGTNQDIANVEITGYGLQDNKSYEKYLIGTS